jgi:hypothetical protein
MRAKTSCRTASATYRDDARQCHLGVMEQKHPHADATYRIVPQERAYGIEVSIPGNSPTVVTSFATEQDAERWIANHRLKVQSTPTLNVRSRAKSRHTS